jgi:hypothetical protein
MLFPNIAGCELDAININLYLPEKKLRLLPLQHQAYLANPENDGEEPGRNQRISGYIITVDIQPGAEEISQNNNGEQQKSKDRFHFF